MADPLSITASGIAIVQLAEKLITLGYTYLGGVKGASKDLRDLVGELQSLGNVLVTLQDYVQADRNLESTALQLINGQNGPLPECALELRRLQLKLEPKQGLKGIIQNLKWPLKEAETQQCIARIQRQKNLFILALTMDNLTVSKAVKAYVMDLDRAAEEINASVQDTNAVVQELKAKLEAEASTQDLWRQKQDSIQMMEIREKILNWIYPDQTDKKHLEINSRRRNSTGDWLIRTPQLQALLNTQDPKLLWGYGIPGAGKTFLSSAVIDNLQKQASTKNYGVAYVYFDYKEQDSQTPTNVIASLVKQLSIQLPGPRLPKEIETMHEALRSRGKRPSLEELYEVLRVLLKPLSFGYNRVFLIFDALDECHQGNQRKHLLPLFHRLVKDGASIFITSCHFPEDIQESFKFSEKVELLAKEMDIRTYIQEMIDESPGTKRGIGDDNGFKEEIVSELASCAKEMFLLVKFHVEYICQQSTRRQIKEALVKLKRSSTEKRPLDPTYDRAMKSIHEKPESLRELAIKILSWLVHAQRTLTVKEVQTAVSVELYRYDIDEKDLPDRATLLEEYLQEKSIIPGDAAFTIAMTCVTFLSFDTFSSGACESKNSIKERLQTYPFFEYAALNLSSHLHKCGELGDSAVDILLRFLANPGSTSSYLQVVYLWRRDYWEGDYDDFEKYPKGCLPLHVASILGVCEVIRVLIEGADFSIPKNTGWEKVYKAASRGHSSVVQLLLEKKANVAMKSGEDGLTALHMAAGHGHEAAIKLLHELGADISGEDEYGETALHVAAEYGHEAAVKLLLELGADISKKSGGLGDTALHIAASFEHVGVVQLLLEKGARISEKNKEGRTALHLAVEYDLEEVVKLLLERGAYADIWGKDADGKTALDLAAEAEYEGVESAHGDVFEILLEHIADTTSHTATEGWYEVATKLLLERGVADISNIDKFRRTALHIAAEIGHEVAIRLLLEQGADISIKNILGDTALHIAASFEHVGVVQLLLEKGASISETNDKGRTALHLAAEYGARGVVGLLLERGVDIWEKDADGKTALNVAAESEYGGRALVILLEHAADTSEDGDRGNTALHTAAEMGYEATIKLLLELGADIFEKNGYGETALHMATKNGHEAAVKLLLELEADILEKDNIGHAASEIAERKGNSEMVELGNAEN